MRITALSTIVIFEIRECPPLVHVPDFLLSHRPCIPQDDVEWIGPCAFKGAESLIVVPRHHDGNLRINIFHPVHDIQEPSCLTLSSINFSRTNLIHFEGI